jgi:hypothetical protein
VTGHADDGSGLDFRIGNPLLEHDSQQVQEPRQTNVPLTHLTPEEDEPYRDLVEDLYQPWVRLEQERMMRGASAGSKHVGHPAAGAADPSRS